MSTSRPKASPTVLLDDARTIATEWRFPPGGETGWHKHAMDLCRGADDQRDIVA
ncbi:MAG: hypothetical protein ACK5JT_15855 [Hyphomicrobiaceae bacterium]